MLSAADCWPSRNRNSSRPDLRASRSRCAQQASDAVISEAVVSHAAFPAEGDEVVAAQQPELVAHGAFADPGDCCQVADAQFFHGKGTEHPVTGRVSEQFQAFRYCFNGVLVGKSAFDAGNHVGMHQADFALAAGVVTCRVGEGAVHACTSACAGIACLFRFGSKRSSLSALTVTSTVAPVSESMAGHRPVMPVRVVTRKIALRPRAKVTFWRMLRIVARDSSIRSLTPLVLSRSSAAPAVSRATSVPPPMAMPTSA